MIAPGSATVDASSPAPSSESPQLAAMRRAPILASVAAVAALGDLAWNRVAIRLVDPNARELWIPLVAHGRLVRNVAGVAALVATLVALVSLIRIPSSIDAPWRNLFGRLTLAGVAGLYLPSAVIALVTPREHVPSLLVVLGLLSGNALVAALASGAPAYARTPAAWASMSAGLTALLAMIGLLVASLRTMVPVVGAAGLLARHGAELGWLLTPLVLLFDRSMWREALGARPRAAGAAAVLCVSLALAVALQSSLGADAARIAYGAFRVAMLPADLTWLYGAPIGLSLAIAVFHVSSPIQRQLGVGVALWVAAGLAPRSPLGTLLEVTAALTLARAALVAHPDGRARLVPYQADVDRT